MKHLAPARIGEPASARRRHFYPIASVMLLSALPMMLPIVASSAMLPPLGLIMFLAWRLLHPTLWPVWIGLPMGLWDDLLSGHPIGTAAGLWTIAMLVIDYFDQRTYWRGYWQDWAIAAVAIIAIQLSAAAIVHPDAAMTILGRQIAFSILAAVLSFPIFTRVAAALDSVRLIQR
jgi:rod shape-determining protein MreD